ncbi:hypothetical protein [Mumia sp. Pv 4-285]|uniref:hypothetical protein n=1 Tax=Mumia qirimensis TaxID=3234852 RepID=UPI00351D4DFC
MIALGLLLVALAVLAGVVVSVEATDSVSMDVLGWSVTTDGIALFWAGAVAMLVAVVGLGLVVRGARRNYRLRKENRELRKEHKRYEKEQASTRTQAPAAFADDHDGRAGDPAYDPASERAYDPAHDSGLEVPADASIVDPYDPPPAAEPYDEPPVAGRDDEPPAAGPYDEPRLPEEQTDSADDEQTPRSNA